MFSSLNRLECQDQRNAWRGTSYVLFLRWALIAPDPILHSLNLCTKLLRVYLNELRASFTYFQNLFLSLNLLIFFTSGQAYMTTPYLLALTIIVRWVKSMNQDIHIVVHCVLKELAADCKPFKAVFLMGRTGGTCHNLSFEEAQGARGYAYTYKQQSIIYITIFCLYHSLVSRDRLRCEFIIFIESI